MSNSKTTSKLAELIFVKMMLLFGVNRINLKRIDGHLIEAIVGWPDQGQPHYDEIEEQQEVLWDFGEAVLNADISIALECLSIESLLRGDRIEVTNDELAIRLMENYGWNESRAHQTIEQLLQLRVDMVDDGQKTDAFFLHF